MEKQHINKYSTAIASISNINILRLSDVNEMEGRRWKVDCSFAQMSRCSRLQGV